MRTIGGSAMRKLLALVVMAVIVVASGCVGSGVGLTEEKVVKAIQNIETARYNQNFSMKMYFVDPDTNKTVNISMSGHVIGVLNKTSGLETGNMTMKMHMMGMDVNMDWPYFINGTRVYFKVDGKWYYVPPQNDLYTRTQGSLDLAYLKNLLAEKNVTIKKLSDGYAFRVNVTFWEFVNATNRSSYLTKLWGGRDDVNVTTQSGWVEVHLMKDGTPTYIETYMKLIVTVKGYDGKTADIHMTIHETVALSDINEHFVITAPKGIEKAGNFDEVFG